MAMYDNYMNPAFAGMKADSGFDRVESGAVAADGLQSGVIVGKDAKGLIVAGKGVKAAIGVTIHSHAQLEPYKQGDCVSVMTRGLCWARVATGKTAAAGEAVKFDANGLIDNTAANTLTNATIRDVKDVNGEKIACVELHAPTV